MARSIPRSVSWSPVAFDVYPWPCMSLKRRFVVDSVLLHSPEHDHDWSQRCSPAPAWSGNEMSRYEADLRGRGPRDVGCVLGLRCVS